MVIVTNLLCAIFYFSLACIIFSLAIGYSQFFWNRGRVRRKVAGMNAGMGVHHGMVIDPKTGDVVAQKGPNQWAWRNLWPTCHQHDVGGMHFIDKKRALVYYIHNAGRVIFCLRGLCALVCRGGSPFSCIRLSTRELHIIYKLIVRLGR